MREMASDDLPERWQEICDTMNAEVRSGTEDGKLYLGLL